ncbi:hypothetical protein BDL97_18G051800 [Sphagnum fallax]|nr:hypothetical protein BDL97_18G051800 [Sphagnum fallax]
MAMSVITSWNSLNPSISFPIANSVRTSSTQIHQNFDQNVQTFGQNAFFKGTKQWAMKRARFSNLRQGWVGAVSAVVQSQQEAEEESVPLRFAVSISTQLLRVLSFVSSSVKEEELPPLKLEEPAIENVNVLEALREDYKKAYFLTGDFTTALYAHDCIFADPTIQFTGRDKYQRNLKLLVPFFEEPSLTLFSIEEEFEDDTQLIKAFWKLRTYLQLPWKPLIEVEGSTLYNINANSKIVKHVESWSISAKEAVWQIFVPSNQAFWRRKS